MARKQTTKKETDADREIREKAEALAAEKAANEQEAKDAPVTTSKDVRDDAEAEKALAERKGKAAADVPTESDQDAPPPGMESTASGDDTPQDNAPESLDTPPPNIDQEDPPELEETPPSASEFVDTEAAEPIPPEVAAEIFGQDEDEDDTWDDWKHARFAVRIVPTCVKIPSDSVGVPVDGKAVSISKRRDAIVSGEALRLVVPYLHKLYGLEREDYIISNPKPEEPPPSPATTATEVFRSKAAVSR